MDRLNAQRVKDFANTQHLADPLLPACPNAKVAATDPMSHRDDAVDDRQAKSLTSSSPASPLQAMIWLRSMALFCEELSIFVQTEVPEDADPSEYTKVPADAIGREEACAHKQERAGVGAVAYVHTLSITHTDILTHTHKCIYRRVDMSMQEWALQPMSFIQEKVCCMHTCLLDAIYTYICVCVCVYMSTCI